MSTSGARAPAGLATALRVRRILAGPRHIWRRSMRVRTVAITVLLSSIALLAVGTTVSYVIAQGLFADRVHQVLSESARATAAAQTSVSSVTLFDPTTLGNAQGVAIDQVKTVALPDGLAWFPSSGSGGAVQPPAVFFPSESAVSPLITRGMAKALDQSGAGQQWQSVALPQTSGGVHPGIIVGDVLQFGVGQTNLYLVYDIHDVQDTLDVVQRSLLLGGLALLLLIAAVTAVVATLVVAPLKQAASMSEELAAGRLEQRIPARGEDVIATLARSFNRMAESLQRQITQLANLSQVQQRFVSDVSHELRTPLTTIRLASDVLYANRADYDAPIARSAELLRTQVQRFEVLLADLLEISRMDAQAAEVAGEPTSLIDLTREGIDSLGGLAADMETEVRLVAPGGHVLIDVDARRIARIIRNLLANAIEHGEGRPVVVTVDSSEHAVGLGVRDHGVGLSVVDAEHVFGRFWRADPSRQRRIGGTGLGLAISLEDAQLHGGTLEVWSRPGEGANFVLTLPRVAGTETLGRPVPLIPADAPAEPAPLPKRRRRRPAAVGS